MVSSTLAEWRPGMSVLCVLEDLYRGDDGHFKQMPLSDRPSIARLDAPTELDLTDQRTDPMGREILYVGNEGGQVDYYAIDRNTQTPKLVKTSSPIKNRTTDAYIATAGHLFEANDEIFPKS